MVITHLSLFTGIGGTDIAAERAGLFTVGQCEKDKYALRVLEKHWPDIERWSDIHELTAESFRRRTELYTVDVISGGFPCQPWSLAGKRKGKDDDRHLWPQMLRVVKELKPTWVIGENVAGFISIGLDDAAADLEAEGYQVRAFVLPACGVDAPHRRNRVFILAYLPYPHARHLNANEEVSTGGIAAGNGRDDVSDPQGIRFYKRSLRERKEAKSPSLPAVATMFPTPRALETGAYQYSGGDHNKPVPTLTGIARNGGNGQLNPMWVEWLMGFPIGWTDLNV